MGISVVRWKTEGLNDVAVGRGRNLLRTPLDHTREDSDRCVPVTDVRKEPQRQMTPPDIGSGSRETSETKVGPRVWRFTGK